MNFFSRSHRPIAVFLIGVSAFLSSVKAEDYASRWEPSRTRVFAVVLNRFKGGAVAPWDKEEHLEGPFVNLLKKRGVPDDHSVFLLDDQATNENIVKQFDALLETSRNDELLIFYFGSHGGYNPATGYYTYSTYDGHLPFTWAFDAIESRFKGSHVLMLADCCFSGGINELAERRKTGIAYACLSSTYSHNLGYSGMRFLDCLIRGFGGASEVDENNSGHVELSDLANFTAKHMAFVAEGKPMFTTTNGFNSKLVLADAAPKKDAQIGRYVEAQYNGKWLKSEITDVKPGHVRVHHTDRGTNYNNWVEASQIRPFAFQHFPMGSRVQVADGPGGKTCPATVLASWESMTLCRFDGYSPAHDEWAGPSRLSSLVNWSGQWRGTYENSTGQKGDDTLILNENADGSVAGFWSGDIKVDGKRINANTIQLSGQTFKRAYQITAESRHETITLRYVAKRLDQGGSYEGAATFAPVNSSWTGRWSGQWENSAGEKGPDSLVLQEGADGTIAGPWSGNVKVGGKRVNANTAQLSGNNGKRAYQFAVTLKQGVVSIHYLATCLDHEGAYEGKSTLAPAK